MVRVTRSTSGMRRMMRTMRAKCLRLRTLISNTSTEVFSSRVSTDT
jgi:hypothetical protein